MRLVISNTYAHSCAVQKENNPYTMKLELPIQLLISVLILAKIVWFCFKVSKFYNFCLPNLKKRVSVKKIDNISVTRIFLNLIKNCVSVKSVYLKVLLYI